MLISMMIDALTIRTVETNPHYCSYSILQFNACNTILCLSPTVQLESVARKIRGNKLPFGGIQLILCGDFLQLPPVSKDRQMKFAFEAESWSRCIKESVVLQVNRDHTLYSARCVQVCIDLPSTVCTSVYARTVGANVESFSS